MPTRPDRCKACQGTGKSSKGPTCFPCKGTGKIILNKLAKIDCNRVTWRVQLQQDNPVLNHTLRKKER